MLTQFGQLISLLPTPAISSIIRENGSNRYVKRFTAWEHLVTMLFSVSSQTTSLRDVVNGLMGLEGKLTHINIKHPPKRSTISDANKRRSAAVFERIYYAILKHYKSVLSDSRFKNEFGKHLSIIDSTTIPLFKDILKCVGRKPSNGKRKGGIKVHMQIRADYNTPTLVRFTSAAAHDTRFMKHIDFREDTIYVFDKGYNDYECFEGFIQKGISFVTRLKHNAKHCQLYENTLSESTDSSILLDEQIELPVHKNGQIMRTIALRRIVFRDEEHKICYEFITNINTLKPEQIAAIYKCRWQIELLHKQLKQNMPLQYFLGDNENAIMIQIWCALIWNLLLTVLKRSIKTKNWAFSNIASIIRLHLFNYLNIKNFLKNPEKHYFKTIATPSLFDT